MLNFGTLLVGSAMLAGVAGAAWLVGVLMGYGAGRRAVRAGRKHQDVEDLLARERAAAEKTRPAAVAAAPSGPRG